MTLIKKYNKDETKEKIKKDESLIKQPHVKESESQNELDVEKNNSFDANSSACSSIEIIEHNRKCCEMNDSISSSVQILEEHKTQSDMNSSFGSSLQIIEEDKNANGTDVPTVETECENQAEMECEKQKDEKIYTVENVIRKQKRGNKTYYLIKWKGYSSKQNTWEPSENVEQLDLVKFYEEARKNSKHTSLSNKNLKRSYYDAVGAIWEVEEVVKKRIKNGEIEYFLKWKDADECYNTWEPRNMVKHSKVVKEFENQEKASVKQKEKNKMFHKMGIQECTEVNNEITYHKAKVKLPKLIEDSSTRVYYDCITFRPITNNSNAIDNSWLRNIWESKMIENNFSKTQREFCLMWNEFMVKNRNIFRGNCHMKTALEEFIKENGEKIKEHKLRAPYIAHVCIMKDLEIFDEIEAMKYIMLLRN